jgi:hypothetical protein
MGTYEFEPLDAAPQTADSPGAFLSGQLYTLDVA